MGGLGEEAELAAHHLGLLDQLLAQLGLRAERLRLIARGGSADVRKGGELDRERETVGTRGGV